MSGDRDEVLGKLSEELIDAMAAGEIIDAGQWAERFHVSEGDVQQCQRGLAALVTSFGEEMVDGLPELPQPVLPSDFEVVDELGRGGMGVVYRAKQRSLDREVAIKVLRPGDLVFGDALRRFRAEARSLARLRHRHIVSVYDSGETPEGLVWFAMDLVDGRTLAEELKSRGRMLPARATKIIRQVTSAIAHAHAQGIVHRDLKPQNVLIDGNGDAFVVDFGLARDASAAGTNTMSGELLGTPTYMSPEQARGDASNIGEMCDVWALGTMLYEMLTGRAPYAGKPLHETIRAILHDAPPSMRRGDKKVPVGLELVCTHALQKRPEDRYEGALAFGEDIERFQDGRGVLVEKPSKLRQVSRVLQKHWRAFAIVAAAVFATLMIVSAWLPSLRRDAIVTEAQRLVAAGHPDAAIESLRAVLKDTAYNASDREELEYAFVQAVNDRAGELLVEGNLSSAASVGRQALAIATAQANRGVIRADELQSQLQWRWQLARTCAVADRARSPQVPIELLIADLQSKLPGRRLLARRAATMQSVDLSQLAPEKLSILIADQNDKPSSTSYDAASEQLRILRDNLRMLPASMVQAGASFDAPEYSWFRSVHACWSAELEDTLAAIATSPDASQTARAVAFHMWARCVGLPTSEGLRAAGSKDQSLPTAAHVVSIAPTAIKAWRTWRKLSREQALKSRIDLIVEAWQKPGEILTSTSAELRLAAENWTGHAAATPEQFHTWWQSARTGSYEQLLNKVLSRTGSERVTALEALDRSAVADRSQECLWRQLAWLQVADGVRIPEAHPNTTHNSSMWRTACLRASDATDERILTARAAVLCFEDGGTEPKLIAQVSQEVHVGEPVNLSLRGSVVAPSLLSLRKAWEDERHRAPAWLTTNPSRAATPLPNWGEVTATVRGDLRIDQEGVYFDSQHDHVILHWLPWMKQREYEQGVRRVWAGSGAALASQIVRWDMGQRTTHIVTVVALHERVDSVPITAAEPTVTWWHEAVAKSFAANNREQSADWLTASLWPTPTALADMLSAASDTKHVNQRTALALAGDNEQVGGWPELRSNRSREFATRLAIGSPSAQQRQLALKRLADQQQEEWTPRIAQTLLTGAAAKGLELAPELRAQLADVPSPEGIFDYFSRRGIWDFLASLGLCAMMAWALIDGTSNRRRTRAILLGFASFCLLNIRIQLGGLMLTPGFVAIFLMTWFAVRGVTTRSAWRVVGLVLMFAYCGFAFSAWFFHTDPAFASLEFWLLGAFIGAFVPSAIGERKAFLNTKAMPPALRAERHATARQRRRNERKSMRLQLTIVFAVVGIYVGMQVLSSFMSSQLIGSAKVRLLDPSGNPVAGVTTYLQTDSPTKFLTGRRLPPSDELGYVDLSWAKNDSALFAEFYIDVQLPGFDHVQCPLESETTIVLPAVGSMTVQLVDHNNQPWRAPMSPFNSIGTRDGSRTSLWFDQDGRAKFDRVACGEIELAGRLDASGLLDGLVVEGPTQSGEHKIVAIRIPESMPRLTGILVKADGSIVERDVSLQLRSMSSYLGSFRVTPDAEGRFQFLIANDPSELSFEVASHEGERKVRVPSGTGPVFDLGTIQLRRN